MIELIALVSSYVQTFLKEHLSSELVFHSLTHTCEVVAAVQEIGEESNLTASELEILIIAAWFHDCGYVYAYTGHEEASKRIAREFLEHLGVDADFIVPVLDCIEATKYPQVPTKRIERVLCDADLYHFAKPNYPQYAKALRTEFDVFLNRRYSDEEWQTENCTTLSKHRYQTSYGKTILERFKQVNIERMRSKQSPIGEFNP